MIKRVCIPVFLLVVFLAFNGLSVQAEGKLEQKNLAIKIYEAAKEGKLINIRKGECVVSPFRVGEIFPYAQNAHESFGFSQSGAPGGAKIDQIYLNKGRIEELRISRSIVKEIFGTPYSEDSSSVSYVVGQYMLEFDWQQKGYNNSDQLSILCLQDKSCIVR